MSIQHVSIYSDHFLDTLFLYKETTVLENIGFYEGLFPDFSNQFPCDVASIFETRCYEDTNFGLLKFVENDCDYTGTENVKNPLESIKLYPNPASSHLNIELELTQEIYYEIFDSKGSKQLEGQFFNDSSHNCYQKLWSGCSFYKNPLQ